jgi:ZIP family zinc transporter
MEQHVTRTLERTRAIRLGFASVGLLGVLTVYGVVMADLVKVTGIGWVAFLAMMGFGLLGIQSVERHPRGLVWGYGLASGAMITSAAVFLVPSAIGHDPTLGGFGIAAGVIAGFAGHTIGHRLTHLDLPLDRTTAQISAHALGAGLIIGVVYAAMPSLGPLLGLAIVSHKGPAGYAAARRLARADRPLSMLLLPAAGVGISALAVGILGFDASTGVRAVVFGFASGIFLHLALDFLPSCEIGSEIHDVVQHSEHDHHVLDELRTQAVASVALGGFAVFLAWWLL